MIKVYSGPHVKFAALLMVEQLGKLGHDAEWVYKVDPSSQDLHIIYQAVRLEKMPKDYILCQTEPKGSHWFTTSYYDVIDRARAIWDYSPKNFRSYGCSVMEKTAIVHPGVSIQPERKKDIDYLFYGWIDGSPHREKMLNDLSKKINLMIVTDKLEQEMWDILARTKVVINIQHKPGNPLEGYRICEAISHRCCVVSEPAFEEYYMGPVMFMDHCAMMNKLPEYTADEICIRWRPDFRNLVYPAMDNALEIRNGLKIAGIL